AEGHEERSQLVLLMEDLEATAVVGHVRRSLSRLLHARHDRGIHASGEQASAQPWAPGRRGDTAEKPARAPVLLELSRAEAVRGPDEKARDLVLLERLASALERGEWPGDEDARLLRLLALFARHDRGLARQRVRFAGPHAENARRIHHA